MQTKAVLALAFGVAVVLSCGLLATPMVSAQSTAAPSTGTTANPIQLPPETATLRASSLAGYALAMQKCLICHSADYINFQAPGMNQSQWTAEVAKMQHAFGAPLSDDEVRTIGAYLAVAYGTATATDASVVAASPVPSPATVAASVPGAPVDVQALLNTHGCLGCHAVDRKLVGPALRDVAAKYKGDALAVSALAAAIRKGGVGQWGSVPMPPMADVSDADAQALATFVLKQ